MRNIQYAGVLGAKTIPREFALVYIPVIALVLEQDPLFYVTTFFRRCLWCGGNFQFSGAVAKAG
jgi:hypothetical protein